MLSGGGERAGCPLFEGHVQRLHEKRRSFYNWAHWRTGRGIHPPTARATRVGEPRDTTAPQRWPEASTRSWDSSTVRVLDQHAVCCLADPAHKPFRESGLC